VFTPFASYYGLSGKWHLIGLAYAAHIPYGLAVGIACENPGRTDAKAREVVRRAPAAVALIVTAAGLLVWQRPWSTAGGVEAGDAVAPGPSAVIRDGRLSPEWVRIAPDACAVIRNDDDVERALAELVIQPGETDELCSDDNGAHRVKGDGAYTGGFLIVDPEA
jgi:hypothetical protein